MKALLRIGLLSLLLSACAHKDLKAPCASLASLEVVPCDARKPVIALAYVAPNQP